MQIMDFLESIAHPCLNEIIIPFAFDTIHDEDTTTLTVKSAAYVDQQKNVTSFQLEVELKNHYAYTNECPCLISLQTYLSMPPLETQAREAAIREFIIDYQDKLIETMIKSDSTDLLLDVEMDKYETWEKSDLLQEVEELKNDCNYIGLSHWAAINLENHIKGWLMQNKPEPQAA